MQKQQPRYLREKQRETGGRRLIFHFPRILSCAQLHATPSVVSFRDAVRRKRRTRIADGCEKRAGLSSLTGGENACMRAKEREREREGGEKRRRVDRDRGRDRGRVVAVATDLVDGDEYPLRIHI